MSIKVENTLNEIQMAGGIYSAKPIETTATATFGALAATGAPVLGSTGSAGYVSLGSGGPRIISGTLASPINPTGTSAPLGSIFINLGATGVTARLYINTDGATAWTYLTTGA